MYGGGAGLKGPRTGHAVGYADADGTETVEAWECEPGCPVAELDRQSGTLQSGFMAAGTEREGLGYRGRLGSRVRNDTIGDRDGASRFFYQAKASAAERSAGLSGFDELEVVSVWVDEAHVAQLRVDMDQSPPRVTGASTTRPSDATAWSTCLFGSDTTAPSLAGSRCITATRTSSTTGSRTLNWLTASLTSVCTEDANSAAASGGSHAGTAESGNPSLTITFAGTASLPGVGPVASGTRLRISVEGVERQPRRNRHCTVKPLELMRWLCRLVTPPGGLVLDPFMGSGTTGCAARLEGFGFIGIEQDEESVRTAIARLKHWQHEPGLDLEAAVD